MYRPKPNLLLRTSLPLLAAVLTLPGCGGKDDPSPSGGESMGGSGSVETGVACERDADCNDFFYCNGEEECADGVCRQGDPIDCDDGISCTVDRCDEESRECLNFAPDEDGDGHPAADCVDADGAPLGDDCDDSDPLAFPGNNEVCDPDNRDEDCDPNTFGTQDADQDGFIDAACCNERPNGNLRCGDDCDDKKTNVNPSATEACDFLDNNCDGETDEGVSITMYEDKDHDGRGDDSAGTVQSCAGAVGFALVDGDCDDNDPEVFEGQFEICDNKDNNCDGNADEVQEQAPWYKDEDGDGFGDPESTPLFSCYRVPGRVLSQNDCNDKKRKVNPNATEICDALDNDCNGLADYKLPGANNFEDDDGDGSADSACGGEDCNDEDPRTSAGAEEVCDRIDNDCDGEVDEQTVQNIWYIDEDGDGWGVVIGSALASCDPIPERASQFGDCDDGNRNIKPGVAELCDGIDQDCDGIVDEGAGVHCDLPNALNTCRFGECAIFSCFPGFADADFNPANGCEAVVNPADYDTLIPCTFDTDCNDADLCNGIETCSSGGTCRLGTPINCEAGPSVIQGSVTIVTGLDVKDLEGIDTITGDLTIDSTVLSSLIGLESLKVIGGNLFIRNNGNLVRLSGSALSELEVVGGDIIVENNSNLIDVSLPSLISANSLNIINNDNLAIIDDFNNLATLEQILYIADNDALVTITEFDALGRIGGAHDPASGGCDGIGGLEIRDNHALETISTFGALEQIDGDVCFTYDYQLTDVTFTSLQGIGQDLELSDLGEFRDINVPALETVGGNIAVGGAEGGQVPLAHFSMPALEGVGGEISFEGDSYYLEDIGFPSLTDANGIDLDLYYGAPELQVFDFNSLEMASHVRISYDGGGEGGGGALPVFAFPELADVADDMTLNLSGAISEVVAPKLLQANQVYIDITSDDVEFIDFPRLTTVGQDVYVSVNGSGTAMGVDFQDLQTVGRDASFLVPTQALNIAALTTIGVPGNSGFLTFNVLPADICDDIARIVGGGYSGSLNDGGQPCF